MSLTLHVRFPTTVFVAGLAVPSVVLRALLPPPLTLAAAFPSLTLRVVLPTDAHTPSSPPPLTDYAQLYVTGVI